MISPILLIILLMTSALVITIPAQNSNVGPETQGDAGRGSVLWQTIGGMTGGITTEIKLVDQTNAGTPNTVLVGTDGGAMAIDLLTGEVYTRYTTLDSVISITDIGDIDSGGRTDFVITTRNQQTPNVIAVSTETGGKLWEFKPIMDAFTEEDGLIDAETISWCAASIPSGSGKDVIVSSWKMVYRLSGENGDVLWTFTGGNDIWNVVAAADVTGDNKNDVLAGSQDGDIHLLNGETGNEVWGHDLTEIYEKVIDLDPKSKGDEGETVDIKIDLSLWSILTIEDVNSDNVPDVVVSSEDGFITLMSGDGGVIIWSKKITLQNQPNVDMENNVGIQSGIDHPLNFFNPRIKTIEDFDGDGLRDILVMGINRDYSGTAKIISSSLTGVRTRQGKDRDPGGKTDPEDNDEIVELDQENILFNTTGTDAIDIPVLWSTEALVNWNGNGNYSLVIPHKNEIKLVDTETKELEPFFDHPILDNAWLGNFQLEFFNNPDGSQGQLMILTLGTSGLLVVDPLAQEVLWDVNNMESVEVQDISDITDDGAGDLVILSSLGSNSHVRTLQAVDRVTGEELWKHTVSLADLPTKGARDISMESDFTGDGKIDILAYRQSDVPDDLLEMGNHTFVFVIDGADGSLAWEAPVSSQLFFNSSLNASQGLYEYWNLVNRRIASLEPGSDLSGDGIPDIFVGGQGGNVYLLDGADGSQLWNMTQNNISWLPWYPQTFAVGDDAQPGLLITDYSSLIYFSNISANGSMSANFSWRYPENLSSPDNDEVLSGSFALIEDLNGDGRSDVMYFSVVPGDDKNEEQHECHVLSGLDGSALGPGFSVGAGNQPMDNFAPGEHPEEGPFLQDLNGDGVKDALLFKKTGGKRAPPQIMAIDGQTHQEIWVNTEIFSFAFSGGNPLKIIEDTNGDGTADIAVGSGRWGALGADIHILDGKTGEQLNVIQYEEQTEFTDWNMAQPVFGVSVLSDVSGDGIRDMMVQRTAQIDGAEVFVLEVVDPETGTLLRQIPIGYAVAEDNGDVNTDGKADILISQGNSLYCLDGSYSLFILSPGNDEILDDEFELTWNLKAVECEVFVDGISFGQYTGGELTLTLSGGQHEIIVETTDEFGSILADSITVNVPESNTPMILNIAVGVILVIFIIVIIVMRQAKLKKSTQQWREKRIKIEALKTSLVRSLSDKLGESTAFRCIENASSPSGASSLREPAGSPLLDKSEKRTEEKGRSKRKGRRRDRKKKDKSSFDPDVKKFDEEILVLETSADELTKELEETGLQFESLKKDKKVKEDVLDAFLKEKKEIEADIRKSMNCPECGAKVKLPETDEEKLHLHCKKCGAKGRRPNPNANVYKYLQDVKYDIEDAEEELDKAEEKLEEIELEIEKREKKIEEIEEDILNNKGGRVESSTVHGEEDEPWEVEE
jgi:ribosomal protein L37AE/L43A